MSLFNAISISASGMEAQRTRAEIITENLANADTTRTPEGGPYKPRRKGSGKAAKAYAALAHWANVCRTSGADYSTSGGFSSRSWR